MADGITSLKLVNAKGECNVYSYDSDREKLNGLTHDEVMNTLRVPLGIAVTVTCMKSLVLTQCFTLLENDLRFSIKV